MNPDAYECTCLKQLPAWEYSEGSKHTCGGRVKGVYFDLNAQEFSEPKTCTDCGEKAYEDYDYCYSHLIQEVRGI